MKMSLPAPASEAEFTPMILVPGDGPIVLAQAAGGSSGDTHESPTGDDHATGAQTHTGQEAHDDGHGTFPPFDPATFGSQIFWLILTFGLLYYLMSKVALPRISTILEERNDRIADDLAEAESLKRETDEAIAAYEQSLAEARRTAHGIAQTARDEAKAEIQSERTKIEAELEKKLVGAETRISKVRDAALSDIDTIAREAAQALVQTLMGTEPGEKEVAQAVTETIARES